mmetsp:Transcript_40070/g.107541  ORF Transcript_40070/g.107541 Transcript_40070/m.107541 type:complete len:186 (-) Transcript_40070:138-695(-)
MARMLAAPSRPGRAVTLLVVAACARTCALASREPHSALPDDALPDDAQLLQAPELLKMALMQTSFEVTFGRDRMLQQQRAERRGAAAPQERGPGGTGQLARALALPAGRRQRCAELRGRQAGGEGENVDTQRAAGEEVRREAGWRRPALRAARPRGECPLRVSSAGLRGPACRCSVLPHLRRLVA